MNAPHPPVQEQLMGQPSVQSDAEHPPAGRVAGASTDKPAADIWPPRAVRNANGSVTLPLAFPQTVRGQRFAELTFHRFTGADVSVLGSVPQKSQLGVTLARATKLRTSVGKALFRQLDMADVNDAAGIITTFCFGNGPQ